MNWQNESMYRVENFHNKHANNKTKLRIHKIF